MPVEGVVHALRNVHAALVPGGLVVDTQPVSARPPVAADGVRLGTLDMREWVETIGRVEERVGATIAAGLYELRLEQRLVVTDTFDSGSECLEIVSEWQGTRVAPPFAASLPGAAPPVTVEQDVRLRVLRRRD